MTAPTWLDDEDDDLADAGRPAGELSWAGRLAVVLGVAALLAAAAVVGVGPLLAVLRWLLEGR